MSKKSLNVLLVEPHIKYPGNTGGSVHLMELVKNLGDVVSLKVVCDCGKDFKENNVEFYNVNCGRFSLLSLKKIWDLSKGVDIIHTRSDPFEIAGPLVSKLKNIPSVGEINTNFLSYEEKGTIRDFFYPFFHAIKYIWLKLITKNLDKIICVSNSIKEELAGIGFEEENVEVVRNGGNPERFKGLNQKECREELGLQGDDYIVLLMGELGPRHGLRRLVETNLEDTTFLVVGGKERYKEYIKKMKNEASENFIFKDPVPYEEIKKYIVASDVTVAPYEESDNSHPFGFCPIKILDSMAAGRPVVASDRPWIKELLSKKEGEITDKIDEGIIKLKGREIRRRKGKAAKDKLKKELSWKNTAEQINDLYKKL